MKTQTKPASTMVSALTARTQLGQILKRVKAKNERFIIGRRGQPQAVVMSIEDYIDTVAPAPDWLKSVWAESKKNGTDKLTMREINAIIAEDRAKVAKKPARVRSK
jgi:prevent-host-death family protein